MSYHSCATSSDGLLRQAANVNFIGKPSWTGLVIFAFNGKACLQRGKVSVHVPSPGTGMLQHGIAGPAFLPNHAKAWTVRQRTIARSCAFGASKSWPESLCSTLRPRVFRSCRFLVMRSPFLKPGASAGPWRSSSETWSIGASVVDLGTESRLSKV